MMGAFYVGEHSVYLFLFYLAGVVGAGQFFGEFRFKGRINWHLGNQLVELGRGNTRGSVMDRDWSFVHI